MNISPHFNPPTPPAGQEARLWETAKNLEAAFLAEMLQHSGIGKTSAQFGGGAGESQFSSFLVREQANLMAQAGGIGLAESLFRSMSERVE